MGALLPGDLLLTRARRVGLNYGYECLIWQGDKLWALRERAKETQMFVHGHLRLSRREESPPVVFNWILGAIPPAWQYPEDTTARIEYFGRSYALDDFVETPWRIRSTISIWHTQVGVIEVHYKTEKPTVWEGPFLREEQELLDNIAHRKQT